MIVVGTAQARRILARLLAVGGDLATAEIHLFAGVIELDKDTTLADLAAIEAVDAEFTAAPAVTWLAPYTNELGQAQVDGQLAQFIAPATPTLQTIRGYWLQTATVLICAEHFRDENGELRPVTISAAGQVVEVAPQFGVAAMQA